jgi:hypothetical protein
VTPRNRLNRQQKVYNPRILEDGNMSNGKQPGSASRGGWPVRLAGCVGGAAGASLALLVFSLVDFHGWGILVFVAAVMVGIFCGQFAGSRLFRSPPDK